MVSYKRLRLTQPQAACIQYAPDNFMRKQATSAIQPILNAYPGQNGIDYGTASTPSITEFIESYSLPGRSEAVKWRGC